MSDNQAEVGIRLKADDQASSVIDGMRDNADKAASGVDSLNSKLSGMAQTAVANFIGNTVIPKVFDYGEALVNNAMHVQEQTRKIGAYFVSQTGSSWDSAMSQADGVESALAGMAIRIGMSIDTARQAFSNMAAMTDASADSMDKVLMRTEQLMQISDITLVPVEAISAEYAMMEKGIVKTKGALTKLLFSTGIFGNNIKNAKKHWSELTAEQRKTSLDGAMKKLAGSMAKAPQSLGSLLESLGAVKQRIMDIAGKSLVANLTPKVEGLLNFLERKRPQLEVIAAKFGNVLAEEGGNAVDWIGEKVDYFAMHWGEIMDSIKGGAKKIYDVAKFIVDNADLIAMAYGMKTLSPAILAGIQNAGALEKMGSEIVKFTGLTGAASGGLVTFTAQLALVTVSVGAAVLAFAAAKGQWDRFQEEGGFTAAWQALRYGGSGYNGLDLKAVQTAMENALKNGDLKSASDQVQSKREAIEQMKGKARQQFGDDAPSHYEAMGIIAMENLVEDFSTRLPSLGDIAAVNTIKTQSEMVDMYNHAILTNNDAMATYIASQAGNAEAMAYGLADNATKIEGGFDGFMGRLNDKTREFVEGMNTAYGNAHPKNVKKKEVKPETGIHMHGGQKFEIKQEFRDADPDRIAIYMRRDFIKAATSRVRSRVRTPFGV